MSSLVAFRPKKILVRMPNWLGDLVMATPVLSLLRSAYPDAVITAMVRGAAAELLKCDHDVDELYTFKRAKPFWRSIFDREVAQKIRCGHYDLAIVLPNSLSSAWLMRLGGVKVRLGYKGHFRKSLLTHPMSYPENRTTQHLVNSYAQLLKPLGIDSEKVGPIRLHLTDEEVTTAKAFLKAAGVKRGQKLIGINPGAAYGSAKCWLPERFRDVARRLVEEAGAHVIFFGDSTGATLVEDICKGLPSGVTNLASKTNVRELMALISMCDAFLTNDSGPMHIASALNVPLVALFGSTSAVATGPYNGGAVIHKHVPCSPCFKRKCPIDFPCMKEISATEVYEAIQKELS